MAVPFSFGISKWPTAPEIPKKTSRGGTLVNKSIAISKGVFSPLDKGKETVSFRSL
jgi:hypothetical protein